MPIYFDLVKTLTVVILVPPDAPPVKTISPDFLFVITTGVIELRGLFPGSMKFAGLESRVGFYSWEKSFKNSL